MIFFSFLLITLMTSQAQAQGLCEEAKQNLSPKQHFVSCKTVSFQKSISADYQASQTAPLMAKPSDIKENDRSVYQNAYPGIKNAEDSFQNDRSLMQKFYDYLATRNADEGAKSAVRLIESKAFFDEMKSSVSAGQAARPWEGKCKQWASWSLDPELKTLFDQLNDGVRCETGDKAFVFTKGELKELITGFYPLPNFISNQSLDQFYDSRAANADSNRRFLPDEIKREDANIALAALGELGGGSQFDPASLFSMAELAKKNGQNLIFDIDPGIEIWNQPLEEVADLVYQDADPVSVNALGAKELSDIGGDSAQIIQQIAKIETRLKVNALQGIRDFSASPSGNPSDTLGTLFCNLKRSLDSNDHCEDLKVMARVYVNGNYVNQSTWIDPPLTEEVELLKRLQMSAIQKKRVGVQASVEKHRLLIRYGVEGKFADSKQMDSLTHTLDFLSTGKRAYFTPIVSRLSQVCRGEVSSQGRMSGRNSLIADLASECKLFEQGKTKDLPVFTSSLPPQVFRIFKTGAKFKSDDYSQSKRQALSQIYDIVKNCQSFDEGARFLSQLRAAISTGEISPEDRVKLQAQFTKGKSVLDPAQVKTLVSELTGGASIPGLSALYQSIF